MTPEALNDYLIRVGITYQQFAHILGYTEPAVHHWLSGQRKVPDIIVKIIDYFEEDIRSFE